MLPFLAIFGPILDQHPTQLSLWSHFSGGQVHWTYNTSDHATFDENGRTTLGSATRLTVCPGMVYYYWRIDLIHWQGIHVPLLLDLVIIFAGVLSPILPFFIHTGTHEADEDFTTTVNLVCVFISVFQHKLHNFTAYSIGPTRYSGNI